MRYQLCFLFCFLVFGVSAQESMKGIWRVDQSNANGTIFNTLETLGYQTFRMSPTFAKFVGHKTLAGIGGTFRTSYQDQSNSYLGGNKLNYFYFDISPMIRKYIGNRPVKPFLGGRYTLAFSGSSENSGINLEAFDFEFGPGIAYFISNQISVDLAFDFGFIWDLETPRIRPTSPTSSPSTSAISLAAWEAWDFQYVPNISLTTNIYLPFSNKVTRKAINPFSYQSRGNQFFGLNGNTISFNSYDSEKQDNVIETFTALGFSYNRFLTNHLSFGGGFSSGLFKSKLNLYRANIHLTQYISLPNSNFQTIIAAHSRYENGTTYDSATESFFSTTELHNGLELGVQYRLGNAILSVHLDNLVQSSTAEGLDLWKHRLIQNFGFQYEQFVAKRASFMAYCDIIPNSTNISVEQGALRLIPFQRWQFGCGYRVYFTN